MRIAAHLSVRLSVRLPNERFETKQESRDVSRKPRDVVCSIPVLRGISG